jgi:hypothetical protein
MSQTTLVLFRLLPQKTLDRAPEFRVELSVVDSDPALPRFQQFGRDILTVAMKLYFLSNLAARHFMLRVQKREPVVDFVVIHLDQMSGGHVN